MTEKPFTLIVLVLLALAITFYLHTESTPQHVPTGAPVDDFGPAPDLSLPIGLNGKHVDLSSLKGNVVLLDFWATWCGPCKMSIPEVESIYSKYKDKKLKVVGISIDDVETRREVDSSVKVLGMTYPVAMAVDIPDIRDKYTFASIPLLIIIDKKGIVRARITGYDPSSHPEDIVKKLLDEK